MTPTDLNVELFMPQKPATLGDLVGVAFRIFRSNWRHFVGKLFWPSLFASISITGMEWTWLFFIKGGGNMQGFALHLSILFGFAILFILSQWELALRCVALLRDTFLVDSKFEIAYKFARKHQWRIMVVYTAGVILPTIIFIVTTIGAILLLAFGKNILRIIAVTSFFSIIVAGTVMGAMALVLTAVWFVLVSLEDLAIVKILERGYELVSPYWWRSGSFICLLCMSAFAVCLSFYLPLIGMEMFESFTHGGQAHGDMPLHLACVETAVGTILSILSTGIILVGSALYCRDLQFRREGQDISKHCSDLFVATQVPEV